MNEISDQELLQQAYKAQQAARNELDKEAPQEDTQGFLGDAVDAFQHGIISGGADLADAGRYLGGSETAGNIADSLRKSANGQLNQMSPSGRDAMQNFAILGDDGEFSMRGLGLNVVSMIGGLAPTMIPGGVAAKALSTAGKMAGATGKVAKAADIASDAAGFGLVGGAASGGSVGNQAYETVMSATPKELKEAPAYREQYLALREQGADHKTAMYQARENVARKIAGDAAKDGALLGAVAQGALGPVFGKLFRGEAGSLSKSISTGALVESGQEFVESGGQRMITNANVNNAIPTELTDGALNDAVTGAVLGGIAGGTFGGAGRVVRGVRGGVDDISTAPQDQLKVELDRVEQNLKANSGTMSREEYASSVELRDSLLNEINNFNSTSDTANASASENETPESEIDQTIQEPLGSEQSIQPEPFQSQLDDPQFQAKRARELDMQLQDSEPLPDMAGPRPEQQLGLQEPFESKLDAPLSHAQQARKIDRLATTEEQKSKTIGLQAPEALNHPVSDQAQTANLELPTDGIVPQASDQPTTTLTQVDQSSNEAGQALNNIDRAASEANTNPTEAQIEADNYKKGRVKLHGLNIAIENPKGSVRSGKDPDGKQWSSEMAHHYGDIKGIKGADGDDMDVFIGDSPESEKAFVVNQVDPKTGKFDEHKVMLGFNSMEDAEKGYLSNYEDNWEGLNSIEEVSTPELKEWIKSGDTNSPFSKSGGDQSESVYQTETELSGKQNTDTGKQSSDISEESSESGKQSIKLAASGKPFATEKSARLSRTFANIPNAEVAPIEGGFGVRDGSIKDDLQGVEHPVQPSNIPPSAISASSSTELVDAQPTEFNQENSATTPKGGNDDLTIKGADRDTLLSLSSTVKDDANTDIKGMDVDQVQKVVDEFLQEYNGNVPLEFRIKNTQEELYGPEATIDNIGRIYGAYHPRKQLFVLAASNLQDNGAVRKTLRHEIIGHYGLNILSPKDKELLLEKIAASRNSPSLKDAWRNVDQSYADAPKNVQAEEIFAFVAENEPKGLEILYDQILSSLNKGLRKVGLTKEPISRSELKSLARRIGNQIKAGEKQKTFPKDDSSSFSKKPSDDNDSLRTQGSSPESSPISAVVERESNVSQSENETTKDEPNFSAKEGKDGGMKVDDVRAAVEPLINDLHERGTFEVVQSINDLPFGIRLQAKTKLKQSKGENPVLRGINAGDKNYLIADGLRNEKEAVEIFLHEVVGHKAVLDMLGKDGNNIMEQIAVSYGRKGLADLIKTYGVEPNTKEGRILLGKEKVAHMAEKGEKPALLKRLVAKVKSWLRNYFPSIKWSDNDVRSLISNARDNVENRYMTKLDLGTQAETSTKEDSVNLSITDRFKEKIAKRDRDQEPPRPDTTFDKVFKTLGQKDKTVYQKFKDEAKRQFKAGGMLPDSAFSEKIKRDSQMNASELEIGAHLGSFRKAVKKVYGKEYKDLPEKVRQELDKQMSSTQVNKLVPFPIRIELMKMRATIKGLSKEYADVLQQDIDDLRSDGRDVAADSKTELLQTILNNLDTYAHRSYRAFDNPEWPKKVSKDVTRKAADYIKSRYTDGTDMEKEERAVRAVRDILEEGTAYQDMGSFIKESKLGAKDLSTLKKRKEIAPEIRELLGEYHDVEVNFAKTVSKMSHLVANHKFLKRLYELGTTEGFFFTDENKPLDKSVVKIAADGSDVMAPLNGLYTYPEIEKAFREALGKEGDMPLWLSSVIRLNGVVKYSKTVLSPTTAMRNIWSAFFFAVANGHFDISQLRKSLSVRSEYFGGDTKAANLDYLKRLKKLGVIYDTPYAGEMMDLLQDSRIEELMTNKKVFSTFTKLNDFAQKFYQYGDDMWKIMGWENEKAMLMKHKGMSEADAEVAAAERIRNTYPTYSMTGRFTQSLRRFPLAGTFVSFPAEIIRTSYHMLRYLKQDTKDSPAYAARKVAGLALVSSLAFAAQSVSKALMGMDDDEEEAVREMAPPWSKNSNLMFVGRDDKGNVQYLDMSFLDPYNYFKRPINAILREQPFQDAATQSASEMLTPFFGVDITFGTVAEVWTNKKDSGGKVFNEQDSVASQAGDIANHLRKNLQPGFASNIERMYKAMAGEKSASGKEYTVADEMAALVGFRASTVDPKTALYYRSFDFKQSKSDANKMLKDLLKEQNDVSLSDLQDARAAMLKAREQTYTKMIRLVKAAKKSGMSMGDIRRVLKLSGVSARDVMALIYGRIPENDDYTKMARSISRRASILYGAEAGREVMERARSLRD